MDVIELPDAASFLDAAADLLHRDTAANNLPLGIAQQVIDDPNAYAAARFMSVLDGDEIVGAALRTPPYPVVLADPAPGSDAAVDALVDALAGGLDPELPGVTANEPWATRFADGWRDRTGTPWELGLGQGVYALRTVVTPPHAPGAARDADDDDRDLVADWLLAFGHEALQRMPRDERWIERGIEARLGPNARGGLRLWTHDGAPVSLTGWIPIPGGARVGPVYTPPLARGRGFASNLVADVSARMLAGGADACFLYTDLGNPTSNAIYRRIGYEQVAESLMIRFGDAAWGA